MILPRLPRLRPRLQATPTARRILLARLAEGIFLVAVAVGLLLGGYTTLGDADASSRIRGPVFGAFTAVMVVEAVLMYLRTEDLDWRRTPAAMFMFRLAIIWYIGSLALSYSGFALFPALYWDTARTLMGLTAAYAFVLLSREVIASFRDAPRWRRRRAILGIGVVVIACVTVSLIW